MSRSVARLLAPLGAAALLASTSLGSLVAGTTPAYASSADPDLNAVYTIATTFGLELVGGNGNDAPVTQSGASEDVSHDWRFQPVSTQGGVTQYEIVNSSTQGCLSVYYNSLSAGAPVVVYECHGWADQLWTLAPQGDLVTIQSVSSHLYLDVPGGSGIWGTQLVQNPLSIGLNYALFGLVRYDSIQPSPRNYRLTTAWSLAMDVDSSDDDAPVIQRGVDGSFSQEWSFLRQSNGTYEVVNASTGKCLSLYYGRTNQGAPLVQYDCHGWSDQQWRIIPLSRGGVSFELQSAASGYYVDVPGGTPVWGTQLDVWSLNLSLNQAWVLTPL
jgi:hypothetical protein